MTQRERFLAACAGEPTDRKSVLVWSASPGHRCDALVCPRVEVRQARETHPDQAVLVAVESPLARAMQRDPLLTADLSEAPEKGSRRLESLKREARDEALAGMEAGADGVFYILEGAYPEVCTPMEYGGFYLDVDRELLSTLPTPSVCHLAGEGGIYFECVADLPCTALAWDFAANELTYEQARQLRTGLLAIDHEEADIVFARDYDSAETWLARLEPSVPSA